MLNGLGMASNLQAQASGRSARGSNMDFFSTHPNTPDRVSRASGKAAETGLEPGARTRNTADFLAQINGMTYGDDGSQGVIDGQSFSHGGLGFTFKVPSGFKLKNTPSAVLIEGPDGSIGMLDAAQADSAQTMSAYLQSTFGQSVALQGLRGMKINGLSAASATAQTKVNNADAALRLVAFRYSGNQVYRFQFAVAPDKRGTLDNQFKAIARSFRPLSQQEKNRLAQSAQRVELITVRSGDTVSSLASKMADSEYQMERFLSINALKAGEQLKVGQRVKIIR